MQTYFIQPLPGHLLISAFFFQKQRVKSKGSPAPLRQHWPCSHPHPLKTSKDTLRAGWQKPAKGVAAGEPVVMRKLQVPAAADERLISPVSPSASSWNPAHSQHYSHLRAAVLPLPAGWESVDGDGQALSSQSGKHNSMNPTTAPQQQQPQHHQADNASPATPNQQHQSN